MTVLFMERAGTVSKVDFSFATQIVDADRIGFSIMSYFAIFGTIHYILPLFDT